VQFWATRPSATSTTVKPDSCKNAPSCVGSAKACSPS
jgi:hypothetical protein